MMTLHWPEAQRWNDLPPDKQAQAPSLVHAEPGRFDVVVDVVPLPEPAPNVLPVPVLVGAEAAGDTAGVVAGFFVSVEEVAGGLADVARVVAAAGFADVIGCVAAAALFQRIV